MKHLSFLLVMALSLGLASLDADAARRFGGGGNIGKQRSVQSAPKEAPNAAPAPAQGAQATQAPAAAPAAAGAAAAAKPGFMGRWGGMLAGLGIGVLLASLFGATLGPIIGMILAGLLLFGIVFLLYRLFASRGAPATKPAAYAANGAPASKPAFSGIASAIDNRVEPTMTGSSVAGVKRGPVVEVPGFEVEPFTRVAKTSFIRLQAANDAGDLDDIRDYTTPEMYAELTMQIAERKGAPQKTEIVSLEAQLLEAVIEGDYAVASVRFYGLIRETPGANPEPFDEVWHVRRKARDTKDPWLIAGIQQL